MKRRERQVYSNQQVEKRHNNSWNLDVKIAKVIETGVALSFNFDGKEKEIGEVVARREKKDQDKLTESLGGSVLNRLLAMDAEGASGGLLSLWNGHFFEVFACISNKNYIILAGRLISINKMVVMCNVYAAYGESERKILWDFIVNTQNWLLLQSKIQASKMAMKRWLAANAKPSSQISVLEEKLEGIEKKAVNDGWLKNLRAAHLFMVSELWKGIRKEEQNRKQKSRVKWLKDGDRNSKFFHFLANDRKQKNFISDITFNGVVCSELQDLRWGFVDFFKCHFEKVSWNRPSIENINLKKLGEWESASLEEIFSLEEVWEVVRNCDGDKARGPDGLNFNFIKANWGAIKEDVMDFFMKFHNGSLIKELNYTFIALVPKVPKPTSMGDFRPISLVGSMYKVVAKVLANRIKKFMASIVGENQMAFIKNRQILDSFMIAEEIFHKWRKGGEVNVSANEVWLEMEKLDQGLYYYSQDVNFSSWKPYPSVCPSNNYGQILLQGIQAVVGKGSNIRLWQDVVIDGVPLKVAFPKIFSLVVNQEGFISELGSWNRLNWEWSVNLRRDPFDWEVNQWKCFKRWLEGIVVQKDVEDTIAWNFTSSGLFSVCSFKIKLEDFKSSLTLDFNLPWKGWCPPKVDFFTWQLLKGRVFIAEVL
ncbi:hypothetical protein Ddye_016582 [Dipteronia dyeriana]|uniref:Reverse transcriptase domain-containing protein n=1 Tax=Dipteronia dyeriana TaxID=168575 RepID=A0AAD9U7P1_9ROSI|nr:hypothetical protein Ddye_016582 [Dipteronia dyeriana]